eukprot:gnl/TRDRNA2_/TRDRNA2_171102_c0_seq1.p1 gnl/TRDRNA2_/TRDRNA2_171102_c0~~gnl/TRDRNA2_/TRDRNA2_171102_c0_seq1.p1  ORF type:complete len:145 (-),score=24.15 gnl/TRDRNA2_/TRDRNA2_171102_c0_seq1:67-501(-)
MDNVIECAFEAIDDDRDGWVDMREVGALFCDVDLSPLVGKLPQDRPFNIDDWCMSVRSCTLRVTAKKAGVGGRIGQRPPSLFGFLDRYFCSTPTACNVQELNECSACEQRCEGIEGPDVDVMPMIMFNPTSEAVGYNGRYRPFM